MDDEGIDGSAYDRGMHPSILAACLAAALALGCASSRVAAPPAAPSRPADATFVVYGMSCPQCSANIDRQFQRIDGVSDVSIDLESGVVSVYFVPGTTPSPAAMRQAIVDSGFTLVEEGAR